MSPRLRFLLCICWTVTAGCGARTLLSLGDEDAGPGEAGLLDAGPRDAGPRDAGPPDGGRPPVDCARDEDCDEGACRAAPSFTVTDLAPLPLECGALSAGTADGSACRTRSGCDRGLCVLAGTCVRPCVTDRDCDDRERCRTMYVPTSSEAMQTVSACAALIAAPADVRVAGPEPGPSLPGAEAVADVLPDLAPGALVVWTADDATTPFIEAIRTNDAPPALLFDAFAGGGLDDPAPAWAVAVTTVTDMVTLLYPNGPSTPASPSGFQVELSSEGASRTERYLVQREGSAGILDVDAYLVGGGGWRSPSGAVPAELVRAFDDARVAFSAAGVTLGEVRVHEVVGELRRRYQILEGASGILGNPEELPDLYRLSAGANRPSVHIFFVRMIDGALGIASGIPGPHVLPGTGASGVAIAVDSIPPEELGLVMVHEMGHFIGLFHTSELDGSVSDPFPDTEECRTDRDLDGDGFLLPEECEGAGSDLVMFWAGTGARISPEQGALMRRAYFMR